jgi:asparagine synthase (glutamine-hydrolysing)
MCGICGMFDLKHACRLDTEQIKRMTNRLAHRGPDAVDYYTSDDVALGFARLSIIDLEGGMQPLFNENGSLVMICNGEIFNYKELWEKLLIKGHKFKTNCDVEVIIHMYEEYGPAFVKELNGQFAFVIFDRKNRRLLCARDQVGIAPFFYTFVDDIFIFASEIKAILEHPMVKREVDIIGLDQILTFPGMVSPRTLFRNINSLEGGHYLVVEDTGITNIEYWDLIYPQIGEINYKDDEKYYIEKLDELITRSIRYRLQADVPVGFYISGGLDSSLIASKIRQIDPSIKRNSFSIDFTDKGISESRYQRMMVEHVNSNHHEIMFESQDILSRLQKAIYYSESALKETYNTASLALSQSVRTGNIKVVLTGEGADELFGGYVGYRFDKIRQQQPYKNISDELRLENELRNTLWGDESFLYEKNYYDYKNVKKTLLSQNISNNYREVDCLNHPLINKNRLKNIDVLHKRSYLDFKLRLCDHLLSDHGDRMAYANSVEARYPFLDKEFIEFARLIPPTLKVKEFNEKYILKKIAEKIVPSEIIKRPKFAFVAPGSQELLKQNIEYINDILSYDRIKCQGYFNPDTVESLKKQYLQERFKLNIPYESDLLIIVITFGIFMDTFNMCGCN